MNNEVLSIVDNAEKSLAEFPWKDWAPHKVVALLAGLREALTSEADLRAENALLREALRFAMVHVENVYSTASSGFLNSSHPDYVREREQLDKARALLRQLGKGEK